MSQNNNQTAGAILIKQEPGINLNSIKSEQPGGRLISSFKLPRDLTLGGRIPTRGAAAANKKVFTPNLNAVRNKNADVRTSKDTSQRGRGRSDRGKTERGRGRGRGGSSLVQTSGLFSEGAAGGIKTRSSGSSYGGGSGSSASDTVAQMRRPTLIKREFKLDPEEEERQIQEILGDDSDEFDEESIKNSTMPVMLTDPKKSSIEKIKTEIKKEEKIKLEKTEDMEVTENEESELTKPSDTNYFSELTIKHETAPNLDNYPESLEEFLTRKEPQMFLLQLPDTLPGRAPDPEPAESAEFERTTTPNPSANFCTLDHLDEGQIGKIVRYKSGKTKLILGEHSFDIHLGMNPGFLQEVMSISTNTKERSGEAINLGRIQAKLSATPDWEFLSSKKNS